MLHIFCYNNIRGFRDSLYF